MRRKSGLFATSAVVGLLALAGGAFAADPIFAPAPVAPAPVAPAPILFDWSGFYVGLNAGYAWGDFRARSGDLVLHDFFGFHDTFPLERREFSADGWFFGGQIGANWQTGNVVFGIETDVQWADADTGTVEIARERVLDFPGMGDDWTAVATASADLRWFGTLRGRLGWAMDGIMPYVTGGLAYGGARANVGAHAFGEITNAAFDVAAHSDDRNTHIGWTIGGGLEAALADNVSLKAEYLFVDLGKEDYTFRVADGLGGSATLSSEIDYRAHLVRVGLNWRFMTGGLGY